MKITRADSRTILIPCLLLWLTAHATSPAFAAKADLSIALSATQDTVAVDGELTYRLEVSNAGPARAKKLSVKDILPANVRFVSASPGCKATKFKKVRARKVTCKLKRLDPGLTATWTIVVKPTSEGAIINNVRLKSATTDRNRTNNTGSVSIRALSSLPQPSNQAPVASSASLAIKSSTRNVVQQLIATDADNDTLTFELLVPASGGGYSQALVNPQTGLFTVSVAGGYIGSLVFPFRATDGKAFSNTATLSIQVSADTVRQNLTGSNALDAQAYAKRTLSKFVNSLKLGVPGGQPGEPPSVDLTANFPLPGDQGNQRSCVGWATAYALKSYQEAREEGWSLNVGAHLFSPAYVYNQINDGQDLGSRLDEALQLIVDQGVATLATTPYNANDFLGQPSAAARAEAARFKAKSWSKAAGTDDIKAALVNRQPVVIGIDACDSLQRLSQSNAVYNTRTGPCFGHAVTVIGYDNSRYGGAFKLINSWGTGWGDKGYFWLPYTFAGDVMRYALVLEDQENTGVPTPSPTPTPGNLPNLEVQNWYAEYDGVPGKGGSLQWRVINSGTATAAAGAYVNLMLSSNDIISANDIYIVYEPIPGETLPGGAWFRDENNPIAFTFPEYLEAGIYYLALWIDDLDTIAESNENDNISLSTSTTSITNAILPDLEAYSWHADWDSDGNGTFVYEVFNRGATDVPAGWDVNLVISPNKTIGDGDEYYLFYEKIIYALPPNFRQYRDNASAADFNLYRSAFGNPIPAGNYYMALWVDDQKRIPEGNETNNVSLNNGTIPISSGFGSAALPALGTSGVLPALERGSGGTAYNGKELPNGQVLAMRQVRISATPDGGRTMEVLPLPPGKPREAVRFAKTAHARNQAIFPVTQALPMPPASPANADGK